MADPHPQPGPAPIPSSDAARDAEARIDRLVAQLSLDEKLSVIAGVDGFCVPGLERIGLPRLKMSDGPAGLRNDGPATTMAGGVALAATWNPELAAEVGIQIGRDGRARGVHVMLGPGVNLCVAPQNGRNFEYFGEDPVLAGRIASSYIRGLQSLGVAATVKHLLGNNSEFARHAVDAVIDERTLREIYLPAFEMAVNEGHVAAIMTSYNRVNGVHMSQHAALVNDVVKQEWGFDGLVMSDWMATHDGVAAANGGQDLEMPGPAFMNPATLTSAIDAGTVSVATIDDKVRRLLRTAIRFGWMEREQADLSIPLCNPAGRAAALQGAREGTVLLKNDEALLPLDATKVKTIAVIGPLAHPGAPVGGGSGETTPFANVSLLQGLGTLLGAGATITYSRGLPTLAQIAAATEFHTAPRGGRPGLTVERFDNAALAGAPVATRVVCRVNEQAPFTLADMSEMDLGELFAHIEAADRPWSARWTGYYHARADAVHEVFLQVGGERGGTRVAIDDQVVIDNWTLRRASLSRAALPLRAGMHTVVLERVHPGERDFFGGAFRLGIARQHTLVDPAARLLATNADVVIVAAGWDASIEGEASDRTFGLPIGQDQLIREMADANPRTVVVLTSGGAVDTRAWIDRVPALLAAWFPGQEGGTALAEILLGTVNPSGHLPISWDRSWDESPSRDSYYPNAGPLTVEYRSGVFVGYRGYDARGTAPQFAFGHGLSYTTFAFGALTIEPEPDAPSSFDVSFDVTNTGTRTGAAVAQVYVGEAHPKVPRPPKELKAFAKVTVAPQQTQRVMVRLDARAFAWFDVASHTWRTDAGEFTILVGDSAVRANLTGTITIP